MYLGTRFIIHRKQNAYVEKYTDTTGRGEPLINPPVAKNMTDLGTFLTEMVLVCPTLSLESSQLPLYTEKGVLASCSATEVLHGGNLLPDILLAARTCSVCLFVSTYFGYCDER